MTMLQIRHRYTRAVLFEYESGLSMREALVKATAAKASLRYANLSSADLNSANLSYADLSYANLNSANLSSANLSSADLRYASLRYANLSSADLNSANLSYADLSYANLSSANLSYADLSYANLNSANLSSANLSDGKKLVGDRPFFSIGPIGSRNDYLLAFITDAGVMIRVGCFFDTRSQFVLALDAEHGQNNHGQEYRAALVLIDKHAELWTPKEPSHD